MAFSRKRSLSSIAGNLPFQAMACLLAVSGSDVKGVISNAHRRACTSLTWTLRQSRPNITGLTECWPPLAESIM